MSKATNAAKLHKLPVISRKPANQIGKSPKSSIMKGLFGENLPSIPTNRSKYDDKPMPPLPDPSPVRSTRNRSGDRFYIYPATPYRKTPVTVNRVKDRASTDPVIPKPLFASKEKVRTQPCKEIAEQYYDQEGYDDGKSFQKRPSAPPATAVPSKASAVLGFYPVSSNKAINEMPSSAPPSTTPPDSYRSSEEISSYSPSQPRQVQSTPVPTRPYVRGNAILTPTLTHSSRASSRQMGDTESDGGPVQGIITGDGLLSPTKIGGYGKLGGATYVDQIDMQRVDSQMGIIETVHSPAPTQNSSYSHHHNGDYNVNLQQPSHEPMRYSHSNYAGIWENDPHVGYSLPPFSPLRTQYQAHFMPTHSEICAPNESCTTYSTKQGSPTHPAPPLDNQAGSDQYSRYSPTVPASPDEICRGNSHPYSAAKPYDSWGTPDNSRGNSYTSSNLFASGHTLSGASLSGSANPVRKNAYPAGHPYHQFGLQPPPVQTGLAHMEMTLHHHIESCFSGLTRLVTDKHDRTVNQVVLRLESLEERFERRSKKMEADLEEMKGDLEEMKKEITSKYEESSQEFLKGFNSVRELVKGVDYKMGSLEKKVEECSCISRHQCANGELRGSRVEFDLSPRRPNQSPKHRRTESAQATFPAQESSPLCSFPPGSHAISGTKSQSRSSGGDGKSDYSSSQECHSNSTSISARSSHDRSARRREYFADLVATRSQQQPPPDLSQHPAFNQSQSSTGRARPLTPIPSLPSPTYWTSQNPKGGPAKSPTTLLFHKPSSRHLDWYQKAFA